MLTDNLAKLQGSVPSFLSPDNYDGITRTIVVWFNFIIMFSAFLLFTAMIVMLCRYIIRYIHHKIRQWYLGDMHWYEIEYSGQGNIDEMKKAKSQMQNMKRLMGGKMRSSFLPIYWDRGIISFIAKKSREDDMTHMYIGVDDKHHSESEIRVWAANANCSVMEIDFEDIGFESNAPMIATNTGYYPKNFTDEPQNDTIGGVVAALQATMGDGQYGSFMITYEPMRSGRSEAGLLRSHIVNTAMKEGGGDAIALSGIPSQVSVMLSGTPSRSVIMAFSDDDDYDNSETILRNSINGMPALGVDIQSNTASELHRRSGIWGIIATGVLSIFSFFGFTSWVLTIILGVMSVLVLFGLSFLSDKWIQLSSANGVGAIPPFFRYSWRRIARQSYLQASPFDIDSGNIGSKKYIAEPSTREVIPIYQTSLMQAMSVPLSSSFSANLSSSAIPQISIESSTNKRIAKYIKSDDVVFLGTSAGSSNDPVFRTIKDLNFGIAYGGDPGSGKTNALRNDFLGTARMSRKDTGIAAGYYINPIWFETKPTDLNETIVMVKDYDPKILHLHDQDSGARLALEGPRLTDEGVTVNDVLNGKNNIISAFEAVIGTGGFGPRSKQVANAALTIAMLLTPYELENLGISQKVENPNRPNIMQVMLFLIGIDDSLEIEKRIANMLKDKQESLTSEKRLEIKARDGEDEIRRLKELTGALLALKSLINERDAVNPLRNKLPVFLASKGLFETVDSHGNQREEFDLKEIYSYGGPVILDMTATGSTMTQSSTQTFTMMVHFMMWESIQNNCQGWGEKDKYIPLYADEVTNFTGHSSDESIGSCSKLLGVMKDLGRSFGVSHSVGFQNFGQLPKDARSAILGFESLVILKLNNHEDREIAMRQIGESSRFTEENFGYFPQGVGAVATLRVGGKPLMPFTIMTPGSDTWAEAMRTHGNSWTAYKSIRKEELKKLKEGRKKRIASRDEEDLDLAMSNTNMIYPVSDRNDNSSSYDSDGNDDGNDGSSDDSINLSWS